MDIRRKEVGGLRHSSPLLAHNTVDRVDLDQALDSVSQGWFTKIWQRSNTTSIWKRIVGYEGKGYFTIDGWCCWKSMLNDENEYEKIMEVNDQMNEHVPLSYSEEPID